MALDPLGTLTHRLRGGLRTVAATRLIQGCSITQLKRDSLTDLKRKMGKTEERYRAYLDESENSSGAIYAVGGFLGEAEVWDTLESKWLACLPEGITSFHATDCFTGNNEFRSLSYSKRLELLNTLADLVVAQNIRLIGYGIDVKTYQEFARKTKENEFLRNKYAAPFGGVVQLACEGMGNSPSPENIMRILQHGEQWEKCAFFFEHNQYSASASRTIADMRNSPDLWFRDRIGKETSGTKSGPGAIPLLQVADLGAFLVAKILGNAPDGKISWKKLNDKFTKAHCVCRIVNADARSLKLLHQTHEELKKEAVEGRNYWGDI